MENIEKVTGKSMNLIDDNKKKIGELFPEVITESRDSNGELVHAINFEKLKQLLSDSLIDHNERYEFTWVGKNKAILEAGTPISKTLRPQKEKSVDWDHTENIYIEGDNLEALKLLQESYLNKIDVIYIDPPYNTGKDFIYNDNFKLSREEYEEMTNEFDEYNQKMVSSKKDSARFHSDWLNMMYSRLKLARNLLSDDGVIFISIDDNEQAHLKELCDEIFGEENFVSNLGIEISKTQGPKVSAAKKGTIVKNYEYILIYQKNKSKGKRIPLYDEGKVWDNHYNIYFDGTHEYDLLEYIKSTQIYDKFVSYHLTDKMGKISHKSIEKGINIDSDIKNFFYYDISDNIYRVMEANINVPDSVLQKLRNEKIVPYKNYLLYSDNKGGFNQLLSLKESIKRLDTYDNNYGRGTIRGNLWKGFYSDMMNVGKEDGIEFKNAKKPIRLIKQLIKWANVKDGYILDFFSGSGTTASATMKLNAEDGGNRKFIMVQLPEKTWKLNKNKEKVAKNDDSKALFKLGYNTITEIGEERIRRAGAKIKEEHPEVDTGFRVFKIDSSNIKEVAKTPSQVTQIELLEDERNIKEDRNDLDLLYQVMIDWGLELSLPYELEQINGVSVHNVFDGALIACFADKLSESLIRSIAEKHPFRVVFKDSSFKNSAMKANVVQIFKEISPETKIKVL